MGGPNRLKASQQASTRVPSFTMKLYLYLISSDQIAERAHLDAVMALPALEIFNFDELLMLYCKQVKICMRPWIGRLMFRTELSSLKLEIASLLDLKRLW